MEYTAIGDTTNVAARLEAMTKGTPHMVFVSDATRDGLDDPEAVQLVGDLEVRGRAKTVRVWAPA
jgi:adenylate cyclase